MEEEEEDGGCYHHVMAAAQAQQGEASRSPLLPITFSMLNAARGQDWDWYLGTSRLLGHIVYVDRWFVSLRLSSVSSNMCSMRCDVGAGRLCPSVVDQMSPSRSPMASYGQAVMEAFSRHLEEGAPLTIITRATADTDDISEVGR